jgi:hypothetical protein
MLKMIIRLINVEDDHVIAYIYIACLWEVLTIYVEAYTSVNY